MAGYDRFFVLGLLVIGLVGVYAGNHEYLSAQQSNERGNLKAASDESLLTIENAAAHAAAEDAPRILKKRSDPNRHGGMSEDEPHSSLPDDLKKLQRESAALSAPTKIYQKLQEESARHTLRQSEQAMRAQEQAARTKAPQSGPSRGGRNPGPSRH